MRYIVLVAVLVGLSAPAVAQVAVQGYVRQNGTVVSPYIRSSPNGTTSDNYSAKGNCNPYTGKCQ